MNVKPLADRVLIEPNPAEERTAGGLYIPDTPSLFAQIVLVYPYFTV